MGIKTEILMKKVRFMHHAEERGPETNEEKITFKTNPALQRRG